MKKTIILKSLTLKNFKGTKELTVNFGQLSNAYGDNGTGKSTLFDGFTWALFDKDSCDRKKFEIKTLNKNNEVLHGLDHMVTAVLEVDGREVKLIKLHREKWTKSKGEAARTLTGNETLYYVDDLPVKASEYMDKVNSIIDENIFKLITNPLYFGTGMKWTDRRKVLLEIIGDIPDDAVLKEKPVLKRLEAMLAGSDIDTIKKSLAVRKRKLNDDIKAIPSRLDEVNKQIKDGDFEASELKLKEYSTYMEEVEEKIKGFSRDYESFLNDKNRLCDMKNKIISLETKAGDDAQKPLNKLYKSLSDTEKEINTVESSLSKADFKRTLMEEQLEGLEKHRDELRNDFDKIKLEALKIPKDSPVCSYCGRPFEGEKLEQKKVEVYNKAVGEKTEVLEKIKAAGSKEKYKCEALQKEIEDLKAGMEALNTRLAELSGQRSKLKAAIESFSPEADINSKEEYIKLKSEIVELEDRLSEGCQCAEEIDKLQEQKRNMAAVLEECRRTLLIKEQNEGLKERVKELMEMERALAQQIADIESQELLCDDFIKTKVELLESGINSKFAFVRFKLFNVLVNGAVEDCCEALINGVPFSNANKAGQINGGLDIINTLCEYYKVSAPIFIDNRESVNRIIPCASQIINLIVSKDAELRVESGSDDGDDTLTEAYIVIPEEPGF